MIDWSLARQIARFARGTDGTSTLGLDLGAVVGEIQPVVVGYSRLQPVEPVPAPELVTRAGWADAAVTSLSHMLEPVSERLEHRLESAGAFAGALRTGAGVTLAAEVGLVTGYMSQRVLGQYELSLLGPELPPRLLFVAPNLKRAAAELEVEGDSFARWVAIHELVHALQFGSVPWLRGHLRDLLTEYLSTVDIRIQRGAAGGLPLLPDPRQIVERFREGGLAALVQTRTQRDIFNRVQAAMAMIEGHAEHVMDALAPDLVPNHSGLREAMTRRRSSRSAPERVLMRLLGMDAKMRQYEVGKAFTDAVVAEGGVELLNRAWQSPEALPTLAELTRPADWIARAPAAA